MKQELITFAKEFPYNLDKLNCDPLTYYVFTCIQIHNIKVKDNIFMCYQIVPTIIKLN